MNINLQENIELLCANDWTEDEWNLFDLLLRSKIGEIKAITIDTCGKKMTSYKYKSNPKGKEILVTYYTLD